MEDTRALFSGTSLVETFYWSVVIYTIIGKNPEELESLKAKNEALEDKVAGMVIEKDKLEKLLRDTQTEVIDKLAVSGKNFKFEVKK